VRLGDAAEGFGDELPGRLQRWVLVSVDGDGEMEREKGVDYLFAGFGDHETKAYPEVVLVLCHGGFGRHFGAGCLFLGVG
jgi:hypothetical protein